MLKNVLVFIVIYLSLLKNKNLFFGNRTYPILQKGIIDNFIDVMDIENADMSSVKKEDHKFSP